MVDHNGRMTDAREDAYTRSTPCEPNVSGELKMVCVSAIYSPTHLYTSTFL